MFSGFSTSSNWFVRGQFDAPTGDSGGFTYNDADGYLYISGTIQDGCCNETAVIDKINTTTGAFLVTDRVTPAREWGGDVDRQIGGLAVAGTNFMGIQTNFNESCYEYWKMTDGSHMGRYCEYNNWEGEGITGSRGATISPDGQVLSAAFYQIATFDSSGEQQIKYDLSVTTREITGLEFGGETLYMADDNTNSVYKSSLPHGVTVTQDPKGIASNGTTTIWVLVDGQPKDKILIIDMANSTTTSTQLQTSTQSPTGSFDAPTNNGEGLTYANNALYFLGKDPTGGNRKQAYKISTSTGAVLGSFNLSSEWNDEYHQNVFSIVHDGTNVYYAFDNQQWDHRIAKSDGDDGTFDEQLRENDNSAISYPKGMALQSNGNFIIGRDDEVVQTTPDYQKNARFTNLQGVGSVNLDIEGITVIGTTVYLADASTQSVYLGTIPHGITPSTDPIDITSENSAYGMQSSTGAASSTPATTIYLLLDGTPNDKIIKMSGNITSTTSTSGLLVYAEWDAPDNNGQGLTVIGDYLY